MQTAINDLSINPITFKGRLALPCFSICKMEREEIQTVSSTSAHGLLKPRRGGFAFPNISGGLLNLSITLNITIEMNDKNQSLPSTSLLVFLEELKMYYMK
jgi:hypothetical protein